MEFFEKFGPHIHINLENHARDPKGLAIEPLAAAPSTSGTLSPKRRHCLYLKLKDLFAIATLNPLQLTGARMNRLLLQHHHLGKALLRHPCFWRSRSGFLVAWKDETAQPFGWVCTEQTRRNLFHRSSPVLRRVLIFCFGGHSAMFYHKLATVFHAPPY